MKKLEGFDSKIKKALNDDFNSAELISYVFEAVRTFNALGFANKKKRNTTHKGCSEAFLGWMKKYGEMSALFNDDPKTMLNELDEILIKMRNIDRSKVEDLVAARNQAREQKDWEQADKIRAKLEDLGVELFDGHERGWKVKVSE